MGQVYLSDPVASVARPVRQLIGFGAIELAAGETATVEFDFHADLAAFTGRDGTRRVEPGLIELRLAADAADEGRMVVIELTGDARRVNHSRELTMPVRPV
ncbi:fibronectin type III-like domain-contianing protein [Arenivirga flava]|uniref:fibronectin type III-like domain-contianing protein n=1 Tax=Arenivirga flava TaxID=1930060 RepID=UPI0024E0D14E|nr:fibronectin type III-like domain-contianing protein [Arenivirga flava]